MEENAELLKIFFVVMMDWIVSFQNICARSNYQWLWMLPCLEIGFCTCNQVHKRPYWIWRDSKFHGCPHKKKRGHRDTCRKDSHVKTEAETGAMQLQGIPGTARHHKQLKSKGQLLPFSFQRKCDPADTLQYFCQKFSVYHYK